LGFKRGYCGIRIINYNIKERAQMQVKQILSYNKNTTDISIDINKYIPTDTNCYRKYENDFLFEELSDLCSKDFRGWYCKLFYKLGREKVLKLASIARADGKNPPRYFSYLLKQC